MQGACSFVLPSSLSRARTPLEDAIASESSSELEGAKTATAEKFWHEAAPSKHNLALDKRKRRANKKGGGGPAGPGLATTVPRSLSVSVSSRRPPWSVVPVIIWSGRWAGGRPLCLSAGQQSRRRRWRAWRWHAIVARLTRSHSDVRTDHALLPPGPDVGPIRDRDWFRSMDSAFRITFARLAACGPMFGFGILSLRSRSSARTKVGQIYAFP